MNVDVRGRISLLLLFFASCGTAAIITAYFEARSDANIKPADLYAVVNRQLVDLRTDNFPAAYEFASTAVQQRFTEEEFERMVRLDYPRLMESSQAEYGAIEARGNRAALRVYLIDRNGVVLPCLYKMVREGDGWRVDGARMLEPWPPTVRMAGTML